MTGDGSFSVDLVGLGLNATDTLISVAEFPLSGAKTTVRSLRVQPGGQVATAVIACQRWGLRTRYIGKLGDDTAGTLHREAFANARVETQVTTVPNCSSAQSHIVVDDRGERTVLWHREPRLAIDPNELNREWVVNARALLVDGCDTAAATLAAKWAREVGIPVIADLDELYPDVETLLENVDYLIVSRDFPERFSSISDLQESLPFLQRHFKSRVAGATLGSNGVLAWDGKQLYYSAAYRVDAIDTTGAGDIFHAGFVYGLLQGWPVQRILDFAGAAAAVNCTATGARGRIAPIKEIEALMASDQRYPFAHDLRNP